MADKVGQGPAPRPRYGYWRILAVAAILAGVGIVLYFSIPIFFSPGSGMGEPIDMEERVAELTLILRHAALDWQP